jgi:valyl-tRNA synthetase
LILLYPITPFTTSIIFKELYNKEINFEKYPTTEKYESILNLEDIENLNNTIWKYKKENNLSLKDKIEKIQINKKFEKIEKDIKKTHNIYNIEYTNTSEIICH